MPTGAPLATKRWSPAGFHKVAGTYTASDQYDVTGVANEEEAIALVEQTYPETAYNEKHPQNEWMYCNGRSTSRPGFNVWVVTVTYASSPAGSFTDPGNPFADPVIYNWQQSNTTEATDKDNTGNLIVNTAGMPFENSQNDTFTAIRMTAVRVEAWFDAVFAISMANSVNNENVSYYFGRWGILFPGQSKLVSIEPISEILESAPYCKVRYTFELRGGYVKDSDGFYDGFKLRIRNAGRRGWYDAGSGGVGQGNIATGNTSSTAQNVDYDVLLGVDGTPLIKKLDGSASYWISDGIGGFWPPVANPKPRTHIITEVTPYCVFLKYWPSSVRLRDHNVLRL